MSAHLRNRTKIMTIVITAQVSGPRCDRHHEGHRPASCPDCRIVIRARNAH